MKYLIGFSVFCFLSLNLTAQNFILKGNNLSDKYKNAGLLVYTTDYAVEHTAISSKIENGQFEFKTNLSQMTEAELNIDEMRIPLLIQPGDNLILELVSGDEGNAIKWSGKGAANNLFFLNYIVHSTQLMKKLQASESFLSGNANRYRDLLNQDKQDRLNFVKNYRSEDLGAPNEAVKTWVENTIRYDMARALVEYPKLYKKIKPKSKNLKIPKDYYSFIGVVDFGRRDLLGTDFYRKFILTWFNEYLVPTFKNPNNVVMEKELINFASKKLTPGDAEYIQYAVLHKVFKRGFMIRAYEKQFENFRKTAKSETAKAGLEALWEKHTFDPAGVHLPDFEFLNEKGKTVRLSDFKNKVLYIKFWATWCKPCIEEMPHTKQLQRKFRKNDDVVFLYVSIDKNKEKWLNWLRKNRKDDPTIHLTKNRDNKESMSQFLNIRAIPHSVIVDANRKVAVYRATWAGYSNSDNELSRVLKNSD